MNGLEPMVRLADLKRAMDRLCPACEKAVRDGLLEALARRASFPLVELMKLRQRMARKSGISVELMTSRSTAPRVATARRAFIRQARALGYSSTAVGAAIQKHHSTVLYCLQKGKRP